MPATPRRALATLLAPVIALLLCGAVAEGLGGIEAAGAGLGVHWRPGRAGSGGARALQQTTEFACPRTDVRAFSVGRRTQNIAPVLVPTTAMTCWAFGFRIALQDVYTSVTNDSVVRLTAEYEGTLVLAEPNRTCAQGWDLTAAMSQYGPAFLEAAHTLRAKPYNTSMPFNRFRVCHDVRCDRAGGCVNAPDCPTRCGGCSATDFDWALRTTELLFLEATQPSLCCDANTCPQMGSQFTTVVDPVNAVLPPRGPPDQDDDGDHDDDDDDDDDEYVRGARRGTTTFPMGVAVGIAVGGAAALSLALIGAFFYVKQRSAKQADSAASAAAGPGDGGSSGGGSSNDASVHSTIDIALAIVPPPAETKAPAKYLSTGSDVGRSTAAFSSIHSATSSSTVSVVPTGTARGESSGLPHARSGHFRASMSEDGRPGPTGLASVQSWRPSSASGVQIDSMRIAWSSVQVGDQIGEGGFGKVYQGQWEGNRVAVKMLDFGPANSPPSRVWRDNLYQEALIMSELRHPCIARVYGLVDEEPHYAIVMQYYGRGTLGGLMATPAYQALSQTTRLRIALQVATGMRFLHEKKPVPILHGDLKTSNLLLEDDGRVVIADFGLASSMRSGMQGDAMASGALTVSISPPEVLLAPLAPRTAAGDVYAFAIVLLEIMTGRPAYRGMRAGDVKQAVIEGKRPVIPDSVPYPISVIIKHCWSQVAADRPSFVEVAACLADAVHTADNAGMPAGVAATTTEAPSVPQPESS